MAQARIGKVTHKPQVVVPLHRATEIRSDRRATFLNHLAASYDQYVNSQGHAPDSMVVVFGGLKQSAEAYWLNSGASEGGLTSMLALAQATIGREINR